MNYTIQNGLKFQLVNTRQLLPVLAGKKKNHMI